MLKLRYLFENYPLAKAALKNWDYDENTLEKLLPLMRRFCNIYSCARLKRCVDERFNDEPDWMTQLRVKLDRRISDLEQGMRG